MFNLTTYMLHHLIHAAYEDKSTPTALPTSQAPVVVTPLAPSPVATIPNSNSYSESARVLLDRSQTLPNLPNPSMIEPPTITPSQMPSIAEVNTVPGITNVIITPQGTKVIAPSGAATILPAGEAVDLAASTGRPDLPPSPPGVENIVLPPGGTFTPELTTALGSRQNPTG
jgi:hypothetical protein